MKGRIPFVLCSQLLFLCLFLHTTLSVAAAAAANEPPTPKWVMSADTASYQDKLLLRNISAHTFKNILGKAVESCKHVQHVEKLYEKLHNITEEFEKHKSQLEAAHRECPSYQECNNCYMEKCEAFIEKCWQDHPPPQSDEPSDEIVEKLVHSLYQLQEKLSEEVIWDELKEKQPRFMQFDSGWDEWEREIESAITAVDEDFMNWDTIEWNLYYSIDFGRFFDYDYETTGIFEDYSFWNDFDDYFFTSSVDAFDDNFFDEDYFWTNDFDSDLFDYDNDYAFETTYETAKVVSGNLNWNDAVKSIGKRDVGLNRERLCQQYYVEGKSQFCAHSFKRSPDCVEKCDNTCEKSVANKIIAAERDFNATKKNITNLASETVKNANWTKALLTMRTKNEVSDHEVLHINSIQVDPSNTDPEYPWLFNDVKVNLTVNQNSKKHDYSFVIGTAELTLKAPSNLFNLFSTNSTLPLAEAVVEHMKRKVQQQPPEAF